MANMKFYLDTRRTKSDGSSQLHLAISHKNKKRLIPLGLYLSPDHWDASALQVTKNCPAHKAINAALSQKLRLAQAAMLATLANSPACSVADIAKAVSADIRPDALPRRSDDHALLTTAFERCIPLKHGERTRESYAMTLTHIRRFKGDDTRLDEVSISWLTEFDVYLSRSAPSPNARAIYMRNLRAVFNFAIDEGWTQNYPFRRFRIKTVRTAKRSLSVDELRTLLTMEVDDWQRPYRDFFALSFFLIGTNAKDLLFLPPAALRRGRICFNRSKTKKFYDIKVEPEALALIKRYKGKEHLLEQMDRRTDHLQYIRDTNHALKLLGTSSRKGCKPTGTPLFPELTTYWARHSWATIAASLDIPKETIAAALGHGGNTVTDIYIDFDRRKVDEANRRVIDWVLYGRR